MHRILAILVAVVLALQSQLAFAGGGLNRYVEFVFQFGEITPYGQPAGPYTHFQARAITPEIDTLVTQFAGVNAAQLQGRFHIGHEWYFPGLFPVQPRTPTDFWGFRFGDPADPEFAVNNLDEVCTPGMAIKYIYGYGIITVELTNTTNRFVYVHDMTRPGISSELPQGMPWLRTYDIGKKGQITVLADNDDENSPQCMVAWWNGNHPGGEGP